MTAHSSLITSYDPEKMILPVVTRPILAKLHACKFTTGEKSVSKKEEGQQPKVSRKELRRQEQEKQQRMKNLTIIIPVVIVALGLIALIVFRVLEPEVEGAVFVESAASNQHDNSYVYELGSVPPTGGVHRSQWQNCGIYTEEVAAEYAVHSMEHGAVWITYRPDLTAEELAQLQDEVRGMGYTLLSPYASQENKVILTAWDVQLVLDSTSDGRIAEFINKYRQVRGPENGASCEGGVGTPVQ